MSNRIRYSPTETTSVFKSTRSYTDGTVVMWAWYNRDSLSWWLSYGDGTTGPEAVASSLHALKKEVKNYLVGQGVVFETETRTKKNLE